MISKIVKPRTKQELVKAIQSADIGLVQVYEGVELSGIPSKTELARRKATVIVIAPR